jgi:membrane-associated phospholipid phosphatase
LLFHVKVKTAFYITDLNLKRTAAEFGIEKNTRKQYNLYVCNKNSYACFFLFFILITLVFVPSYLSADETAQQEEIHSKILPYFTGSGDYFKLNPITDSILLSGGTALYVTDLNLQHIKQETFDGSLFNRDDVNVFDRWAMHSYSKTIDVTASVLCGVSLATPLVLAGTDRHEWITIGTMYAETILISQASKEFLKALVYRPRPYMYFDGYPQEYVDSGDWDCSFPSGHTTLAFAGAAFTSYVFCTYFPDSPWCVPVVAGSYTLAAATAVLRIWSGNHFLSDVLASAAIGTAVGIGVPLLHRIGINKSNQGVSSAGSTELSVIPAGLQVVVRF